ncbi:hypothetical protein RchiOBHm_Chr1g0369241 [Rosa chinensis]|uniref:Uncharacterized protein n=1 Tax=Rosa chinensis TaxID=74649 RepID=A0A2P6SL10_ROSCH|nr:hypothetical protein RchiOBHm_Chr1g0369241 [Rosa chinensis]
MWGGIVCDERTMGFVLVSGRSFSLGCLDCSVEGNFHKMIVLFLWFLSLSSLSIKEDDHC